MLTSTSTRFAIGAALATAALAAAAYFAPAIGEQESPRLLPPLPRRLPPPLPPRAIAEPLPLVAPRVRKARSPRKSVAAPSPTRARSPLFIVTVACDDTTNKLTHRHTFKVKTAIEGEARQLAEQAARRFSETQASKTRDSKLPAEKRPTISAGRVETCGLFVYRPRKARPMAKATSEGADAYNERHAIEYARWLAARDGRVIKTDASGCAIWSGINSRLTGKWCRRVRAVRLGAVEIVIPNWDFEPSPATEEILPDAMAA